MTETEDAIACWRFNYGLDKSPQELHDFWNGCAQPGAVLALKSAVERLERLRAAAVKAQEALKFAYGGAPIPALEGKALDMLREALEQ